MKTLVAGWFSFSGMGATAGDLIARDIVSDWLGEAGVPYDVACDPPFTDGIDWRAADPRNYDRVVFVCGPLGNGEPFTQFRSHFAGRRFVGVDLSMLQPLAEWNPFDLLLERDSDGIARPDLAFLGGSTRVPVVGIVLAHMQSEYKDKSLHAVANAAIKRLTGVRQVCRVDIDTCLDPWNNNGFRTPAEVESIIAKMDVVVTTRLHGTVLALKNGVPVVAIDPVAGGAKIRRQCQAVGWRVTMSADELTDERLAGAFEYCLSDAARAESRACASSAVAKLAEVRERLRAEFARV